MDSYVRHKALSFETFFPTYSHSALAFLLSSGPSEQALAGQNLDANTKEQLKSKYNEAGIKIVVSAFGSVEQPTTAGVDPTKAAETMSQWVIDNGLDGIDVDYEDQDALASSDGEAVEWIITFTKTLRSKLPPGKYTIMHARELYPTTLIKDL